MSYVQLTSEERYVIYHLKLYRLSLREIGRCLGRSHTTISRELKRNGPIISSWVYWHQGAHEQALKRRKQARHYRRRVYAPLVHYVEQSLRAEWSPDVIAAKLKMAYPNDIRMRVSIETVYRWVYRDASQGGQLFSCLCRCHKKRRRQHRYGTGRGLIPGRVSIHLRPDLVATRQRFGDWEGDTVEGAKGSGNITTHVERKSRYLIAGKLINKTAIVTAQAATTAFRRIPKETQIKSKLPSALTRDEFHVNFFTGAILFFCIPLLIFLIQALTEGIFPPVLLTTGTASP